MFIHWWHLSVDQNQSQFKNAIQMVEKTPRYNLQYTISHLSHSLLGVECMTRSIISVNHFRFSNCVKGSCKSCLEYTRNALVFHQLDTTFMTAEALNKIITLHLRSLLWSPLMKNMDNEVDRQTCWIRTEYMTIKWLLRNVKMIIDIPQESTFLSQTKIWFCCVYHILNIPRWSF